MTAIKYTALAFMAFWGILLLAPVPPAYASSVREVTMDEMLQQSQFVFEGTVVSREARENSQGRIHTYVTFEIRDVIKGEHPDTTITLSFLGGTVGAVTMAVSEMEFPQVGERGIYFVESLERLQVHPLYGWSQGHFIVEPDGKGTDRVMTSSKQPVTEIVTAMPVEQILSSQAKVPTLSKGVARGVTLELKENDTAGLTVGEFKKALLEKMRTGQ